jgi:hypothetical protein
LTQHERSVRAPACLLRTNYLRSLRYRP